MLQMHSWHGGLVWDAIVMPKFKAAATDAPNTPFVIILTCSLLPLPCYFAHFATAALRIGSFSPPSHRCTSVAHAPSGLQVTT